MGLGYITVWDIIRRFVIGWLIGGLVIVGLSCIQHGDLILDVISKTLSVTLGGIINAILPLIIILFGIMFLIRSVF